VDYTRAREWDTTHTGRAKSTSKRSSYTHDLPPEPVEDSLRPICNFCWKPAGSLAIRPPASRNPLARKLLLPMRRLFALIQGPHMKTSAFLLVALAMSASAFSQTSVPAAPTLTAGAGFKGLRFDWDSIPGATWYQLEYRAHQTGAFTQQGDDFPATATSARFSFPLHLYDWTYARYRLAACNSAGCSRSAAISVSNLRRDAVGYFKASQSKENAWLGTEADLSSDGYNLVATAPGEATLSGNTVDGGAVYVYKRRSNGSWFQRARLQALDHKELLEPEPMAQLVVATSGSGNTVAVGMPSYGSRPSGGLTGEVDIFRFTNGAWSRTRIPHGPVYFGQSVTLSEDGYTLVVGINGYNNGGFQFFRNSNGVWRYVRTVSRPSSGYPEECYATRLSRDFSTVADYCTESGSSTRPHREYVRVFSGTDLSVRTDIDLETQYGHTGFAVDRTGDTVAIQFSRPEFLTGTPVGEVRVFKRTGSAYAHVTTLTAGTWRNNYARDHFGDAVAFSGDGHTLVIGDPADNGTGWGPRAAPLISGTEPTGGAYVYRFTDQWRLVNMVKPNANINPRGENRFGGPIVLSQTGKTLVIAAKGEDSAASGIDGDWTNNDRPNSGALFMY
jgi:hypothetical protein